MNPYTVKQDRELLSLNGILTKPSPKSGKTIADEVVDAVKQFFCNDNYSRLMRGKKDFVSVQKNIHEQKCLLLCYLSELYSNFKQDFPKVKIYFTKFCSLRPKWCITVGSSGAHSVCVCTIHKNVKLMVDAIKLSKSYKELIQLTV